MDIFPGKDDKLVFVTNSPYQKIKVFDKLNGLRYMTLNSVQQGGHLPGRPERLLMPYFKLGFTSLLFTENATDFLFVGLGMGGMPAYLRTIRPDAEIDVVEIDPGVFETARDHFGFREDDKMRVTIADGRKFVQGAKKKYDVVFLDAYRDISVPTHLTTVEFMREVRSVLKPGGVAVSNLWGSVVNQLFDSCVRTLSEVFPRLYKFRSFTYNYIFIATTEEEEVMPGEILGRAKALMKHTHMGFDMIELVRRQYNRESVSSDLGEVLTDEKVKSNTA